MLGKGQLPELADADFVVEPSFWNPTTREPLKSPFASHPNRAQVPESGRIAEAPHTP